jgi:hypothetical protein
MSERVRQAMYAIQMPPVLDASVTASHFCALPNPTFFSARHTRPQTLWRDVFEHSHILARITDD